MGILRFRSFGVSGLALRYLEFCALEVSGLRVLAFRVASQSNFREKEPAS